MKGRALIDQVVSRLVRGPVYGPFFTFISVRFDAGQIKSFEDFRMAEITASLVKELRERTGAGMMDCKKR